MYASDLEKQLQSVCETLKKECTCQWEWDAYMGAALSAFEKPAFSEMRSLLEQALPLQWTDQTIVDAPKRVQELAESLGGLRTGQALFVSDPVQNPMLFAAWWPWGGGDKVSVRVSMVEQDESSAQETPLHQTIQEWFGVQS